MGYRPVGLVVSCGVLLVLMLSGSERRAGKAEPAVHKGSPTREVKLPSGLSKDRWTAIKRDITRRNLEVRELKDGNLAMATPSFRAEFREEAVHLAPHNEAKGAPWFISCRWAGLGDAGPGTADISREGRVARVETRAIVETFENRTDGIEHRMQVREPGSVGDLMTVRLDVTTGLEVVASDPTLISFLDAEGNAVFEYRGLRVWDSTGKNLDAELQAEDGDILVAVHTTGARFPVTIDPLWRNANGTLGLDWSDDGLTDRESLEWEMGFALCLMADLNGDGDADLAVGAPGFQNNLGAVFIYYGTGAAGGFDDDLFETVPTPLGQEGMRFGSSLAAGDINGDDIQDLVVGAPGYDTATNENAGAIWVLLGTGIPPGLAPPASSDPALVGEDLADAEFGAAISVFDLDGDVDDDDVVVGAPGVGSDTGIAYVYFAIDTAPYFDTTIQWSSPGPDQEGARFGTSISRLLGNFNADAGGLEDFAFGAPGYNSSTTDDVGIVYVYFGTGDDNVFEVDPWIQEGPDDDGAQFGFSVDIAGDPNGDGDVDLVVGAPGSDAGGTVYLFFGPSGAPAAPGVVAFEDAGAAQLGFCVAGTGADYDADGDDDFLAGDPSAAAEAGEMFVLNYDAVGVAIGIVDARGSPSGPGRFGHCLIGVGDVTGDGDPDVAVAMPSFWSPTVPGTGGVLAIYDIAAPGAVPPVEILAFIAWPDFGWSVAFAGTIAGPDGTNDAYGDVLVGAPNAITPDAAPGGAAYLYLGTSTGLEDTPAWVTFGERDYGFAVAGVGDVNADGLPDIMVGDPGYTGTIGESAGRVYLYLGIADALPATTPDWTSSGDEDAGSYYGWSIDGIGDVDGDGFGDVIVGAPEYDDTDNSLTNAGRVYVYAGTDNPDGLEDTPLSYWTGLVAWEYFGYSVAGVGFVDGDEFPDVLVGAPFYSDSNFSNMGAAFFFSGGDTTYGITGTGSSNGPVQAGAFFGFSVSGGVDVDNDTLDDIIVGAPGYNNGTVQDTGRVHVYLGVAGDPFSAAPFFQNVPTGIGTSARLGSSVVGVGLLPGDAYGDVVAGGPTFGLGIVILINGGAAGMTVPFGNAGRLFATAINPAPGRFGFSLAAGDVTGDGTPDVIVGAPGPLQPAFVQQAEGAYLFRGED